MAAVVEVLPGAPPTESVKATLGLAAAMAWTAWLIGAVVVASLAYMVWASTRKAWNAEGQDDLRRHEATGPTPSVEDEESE